MRALVGRTAARQQQHRCCAQGIASGLGSGGGAPSSATTTMQQRAGQPSAVVDREHDVRARALPPSATDAAAVPAADHAAPSLQQPSLPHYADYPIDRAAELRTDAKAIAALFAAPQSRLLPVLAPGADSAARVLVVQQQQHQQEQQEQHQQEQHPQQDHHQQEQRPLAPAWVRPASAVSPCLADGGGLAGCMFLGLDADGAGVFAGRVRPDGADGVVAAAAASSSSSAPQWAAARTAGPDMSPGDAALVATAAGLASWHASAQFDGTTGLRTKPRRAGHSRGVDPAAAAAAASLSSSSSRPPRALYPRVDPATIMLVKQGAWALLGRKAEWPAGRWSTLAGFLECGETFEQCVCRETAEESGVPVDPSTVQYVESQPWPFPRSLMVGFYAAPVAVAEGGDGDQDPYALLPPGAARRAAMDVGLTQAELQRYLLPRLPEATPPASGELEDVRWFYRGWVRRTLARHCSAEDGGEGLFHVPGHYSLGHRLVHGWLREQGDDREQAADEEQEEQEEDGGGGSTDPLAQFASADIGEPGTTFKYVLMRVFETSGRNKLAVWGHPAAEYHNHVLQRGKARAQSLGLAGVDVLGGGRIRHDATGAIHVYGYSAAFGPSPHEVSAAILRRWFPFSSVTVSYEGY